MEKQFDMSLRTGGISRTNQTLQSEFSGGKGGEEALGESESPLRRKQAEQALRESEGYLRTVLGSIQTGVIVIDAETHEIIDANKVASDLIGIAKEKMIGGICHKFICPKEIGQCPITDLGQVIDNSERILLGADGKRVPIIKSVVSVALHGRQCLLESFVDITERKRGEEILEKLRRQNELILNSAGEGILGLDREGKHTFVNPAAARMLGYKDEELIGRHSHSIWHHTKPNGSPYPEEECQILSSYKDGHVHSVANEVFWRKDGRGFPVEYTSTPIIERGILVGAVVTFTDITERKQAEEALKKKTEELARSNKELEQFAYVASHDLQEPLRMVTSYVQLLSRRYEGKLDGNADEFIAYAVDGATRMQRLINDLLTYSRVGTKGKEFEPTDCERVFEHSLKNLQVAIEEQEAVITHDPLPTVMADHVQLGQLFQNLIGNAIKFRGKEAPHIHLSARSNGNGWLFSVRDNGIGIALEYAERIFIIFQRLHNREEYPGTGIGLAVCKKIVERHGGHIWVESDPGKGATFYFTILNKGGEQA
jgi:PAS domain S-box-containing protein